MAPGGRSNPTADGAYVCARLMATLAQDKPAVSFPYSRFREFLHAKPFTQVVRVEISTGHAEVIHEDPCYIGHVNRSPTLPDILTSSHEGPWDLVDQRRAGSTSARGSWPTTGARSTIRTRIRIQGSRRMGPRCWRCWLGWRPSGR
ncbi:MAG: oligogalacturonate lyase family protein [Anaerolineae bacterium]